MLRRTAAAALTGAVLVFVAGCDPLSDGGDSAGPGSDGTIVGSPSVSAAAASVPIDKSVWYRGMKLTFGTAVSAPGDDGGPGTVTVDVQFDNLGPTDHNSANLRTSLMADGTPYRGAVENAPVLPGSARSKANIVFQTGDTLPDLSAATITVGDGSEVQATVPFAPDGESADLAPKTVVSGPKVAPFSEVKITISGCDLRADDPARGEQARKGKRLIVCGLSVHNQTGGFTHVYNNEFQVKASDGTSASATYGTMQEVGIDGGGTHEASLAWEIAWPSTGSYTLAVAWLGGQGRGKPTAQNTMEIPLPLG